MRAKEALSNRRVTWFTSDAKYKSLPVSPSSGATFQGASVEGRHEDIRRQGNPVGSEWINLSEPSYGIHGAPGLAEIDKDPSHDRIRLTNSDAEEPARLVEPGVTVEFIQ